MPGLHDMRARQSSSHSLKCSYELRVHDPANSKRHARIGDAIGEAIGETNEERTVYTISIFTPPCSTMSHYMQT